MDSSITAAGRALRAGDPLGALKRVALREDPAALALRGIAMAQLGDLPRARGLLRRAARGFGPRESLDRARCLTAEAEVAFAARDLGWPSRALGEALRIFVAHGDRENAGHTRLLQVRLLLLLGRVDQAGRALVLPAARLVVAGESRPLRVIEVAELLASSDLIVDGCRRDARRGDRVVQLSRRPVLFALLRALGEAWPEESPRSVLMERAFGVRRTNDSHRARLRVEMGR